jgi:CBS domain containing-hemolysin-like protein
MVELTVYITLFILFVAMNGLFAGSETGVYQLSRLRLRLGVEQKRFSSVVLAKTMRDSPALLISLLIGTNLACYLATSAATFALLGRLQSRYAAGLVATMITAPVLFVFAELIPKTIFYYRSDSLTPICSPVLFVFHRIFSCCGLVSLLKAMAALLHRLTGSPAPPQTAVSAVEQSHIHEIFHHGREEGLFTPIQADIVRRLVEMSRISLKSVMTPLEKARMTGINADRTALLSLLEKWPYTRFLVYQGSRRNIVGFINIYEALTCGKDLPDLRPVMKPLATVDISAAVIDVIGIMQSRRQRVLLVVRPGYGRPRPLGIVTMKDLVEELVGEFAEW